MKTYKGILISLIFTVFSLQTLADDEQKQGVGRGGNHPNVNKLRMYALDCGDTIVTDKGIFDSHFSGPFPLEVRCFLFVHPDGVLLWDTGHTDKLEYSNPTTGSSNGTLRSIVSRGLLQQLLLLGFPPQRIEYLAFSHMHFDHTGNANAFRFSTLIAQKEEFDTAFGPDVGQFFGFRPETYDKLKDNPRISLQGDHDVFGDGSLIVKRAIGHTPGSQVLFANLENTGPIVLSGDLFHFEEMEAFDLIPPFNYDLQTSRDAIEAVRAFLDETGAELWITHDPIQMNEIRIAPAYYD